MSIKELHSPISQRLVASRGKGGLLDEDYFIKALEELDLEFKRKINNSYS